MLNRYGFKSGKQKFFAILLIVLYVASGVFLLYTNMHGSIFILGDANLSGVITGVQTVIVIGITVLNYRFGGKASMILMSASIASTCIGIFGRGNTSAIPGLIYYIASFLAVSIIMYGLSREEKISYTDRLTSLSNRRSVTEHIEQLVIDKTPFQLVYMSLDHFKFINDTMGHEKGDEILTKISELWNGIEVEDGHLGRMGGDEFICIITKKDDAYVDAKAKEFVTALSRWVEDLHTLLSVTASVGIASFPENGDNGTEILRKADVAMYTAKNSGRNRICRYNESYDMSMLREQRIETLVKDALADNRFYMVYQPQYVTSTHEVRGFEALIRMDTGEREVVGPAEFIPVAEKTDLIVSIGEYVMNRVMADFSELLKNHKDLKVSINLSPKQILSPNFIDFVKNTAKEYDFPLNCLEIEITEYCLMESTEDAITVINKLKRLGIQIAMDDFGTGYSSLSYLTKLPIDLIKIDKSLIDTISEGEIVNAIIMMGHTLGCRVISEGVEDEYQLDMLNRLGCDFIQGYIWSKPIPLGEAKKLL